MRYLTCSRVALFRAIRDILKVNSQSVVGPESSFERYVQLKKNLLLLPFANTIRCLNRSVTSRHEITKRTVNPLFQHFQPRLDSSEFFRGSTRTRKRPTATSVPDCCKKQRTTRAASPCAKQEALNCKVFLIYLSNRGVSEHGKTHLVTFRRCTGRA